MSIDRQRRSIRDSVWVVVAITLLTMGIATTIALLRPAEYRATASVVVHAERLGPGTPLQPAMGTERELALSGAVAEGAGRTLHEPAKAASLGLDVQVPVNTNVLRFNYTAKTATRAHAGAQAFASSYVDYRNGGGTAPARIITEPSVPRRPEGPNLALVLGASLLAGMALGIGTALAWRRLSPWLRDSSDAEEHTGLPLLAQISTLHAEPPAPWSTQAGQLAKGKEAYGQLAARLTQMLRQRRGRIVLTTSPSSGAGHATVVSNLVSALALTGRPVVLVSADPHSSNRRTGFHKTGRLGLLDVLAGACSLDQALHDTEVQGLRLLPWGVSSGRPSEVLNLSRLSRLLDDLATSSDVVVVEAPAVLGGAETPMLAQHADLVVLLVDVRRGLRSDAVAAVAALSHVSDKLAGCVTHDPGHSTHHRRPRSTPAPADPLPELRPTSD